MKRFEQLKSQYAKIIENNVMDDYSDIMVSCITSDFDRLFELIWKTLKEYMQKSKGIAAARTGSPRDILSLAFSNNLISDEKQWIDMLNDRNDDTHIYSQTSAVLYKSRIEHEYLPEVGKLLDTLKTCIPEDSYAVPRFPQALLEEAKQNKVPKYDLPIEIEEPVCRLAAAYGFSRLVLFGSRARNDNSERSDVDLAVFNPPSSIALADFKEAIKDTRKVPTLLGFDVVNMNSDMVDPEVRSSILEDGIVLYERDFIAAAAGQD